MPTNINEAKGFSPEPKDDSAAVTLDENSVNRALVVAKNQQNTLSNSLNRFFDDAASETEAQVRQQVKDGMGAIREAAASAFVRTMCEENANIKPIQLTAPKYTFKSRKRLVPRDLKVLQGDIKEIPLLGE